MTCHTCGELGHITKNCPVNGGAGKGVNRGKRSNAAIAKNVLADDQQKAGEADAHKEIINDLKAQIKKLAEKPGLSDLPDRKASLISVRPKLKDFQSCPEPEAEGIMKLYLYAIFVYSSALFCAFGVDAFTALVYGTFAHFALLCFSRRGPLARMLARSSVLRRDNYWAAELRPVNPIVLVVVFLVAVVFIEHLLYLFNLSVHENVLEFAIITTYLVSFELLSTRAPEWATCAGHIEDTVKWRYERIGVHEALMDHDHRGPMNRAQAMTYTDPHLADWLETPGGGTMDSFGRLREPRVVVISETLFSILVCPAVRLLVHDPKLLRDKQAHIAKTCSVVNIAASQDAELGIVVNTVNAAFCYAYGYELRTKDTLYANERLDPLNVVVPARY
jgi:hypothetical protein